MTKENKRYFTCLLTQSMDSNLTLDGYIDIIIETRAIIEEVRTQFLNSADALAMSLFFKTNTITSILFNSQYYVLPICQTLATLYKTNRDGFKRCDNASDVLVAAEDILHRTVEHNCPLEADILFEYIFEIYDYMNNRQCDLKLLGDTYPLIQLAVNLYRIMCFIMQITRQVGCNSYAKTLEQSMMNFIER